MAFGWGGIFVGYLCRGKLVGMGEYLHWLIDINDLNFYDIVYMLQFLDVAFEFRRVGKLDII